MDKKTSTRITLSDGKEITVSLLPLRSYGQLLITLQNTFKDIINEWDSVSDDEIIGKLPEFISNHMDEAGGIIEVGTRGQVTASEALDQRGLADSITIIVAILEVNDVEGMVSTIKKAVAAFKKHKAQAQSPAPQQPTTGQPPSN